MAARFSWKTNGTIAKKPWGDEEKFSAPWGTSGKVLHIAKNHRTSLKAYERKDEILYLYKGSIKVVHGNDDQNTEAPEEGWKLSFLEPGEMVNSSELPL